MKRKFFVLLMAFTMAITSMVPMTYASDIGAQAKDTIDQIPKMSFEHGEKIQEETKKTKNVSKMEVHRLVVISSKKLEETYGADHCIRKSIAGEKESVYVLSYDTVLSKIRAKMSFKAAGIKVLDDKETDLSLEDELVDKKDLTQKQKNELKSADSVEELIQNKATAEREKEQEEKQERFLTVAVVDSGVDSKDFGVSDRLAYYDKKKDKILPVTEETDLTTLSHKEAYVDTYGHGTVMAKAVIANTSKDVRVLPIKAISDEGEGSEVTIYAGIKEAIESRADIINVSLSGIGRSELCQNAIEEAKQAGIPVVVASGNQGNDTNDCFPANVDEAYTISATYDKRFEQYSNKGDQVDYAADGSIVLEEKQGDKIEKRLFCGTSVSAAYVSSMLANLKIQYENGGNKTDEIFSYFNQKLKEKAQDLGDTGKDDYYGFGYLDKKDFPAETFCYTHGKKAENETKTVGEKDKKGKEKGEKTDKKQSSDEKKVKASVNAARFKATGKHEGTVSVSLDDPKKPADEMGARTQSRYSISNIKKRIARCEIKCTTDTAFTRHIKEERAFPKVSINDLSASVKNLADYETFYADVDARMNWVETKETRYLRTEHRSYSYYDSNSKSWKTESYTVDVWSDWHSSSVNKTKSFNFKTNSDTTFVDETAASGFELAEKVHKYKDITITGKCTLTSKRDLKKEKFPGSVWVDGDKYVYKDKKGEFKPYNLGKEITIHGKDDKDHMISIDDRSKTTNSAMFHVFNNTRLTMRHCYLNTNVGKLKSKKVVDKPENNSGPGCFVVGRGKEKEKYSKGTLFLEGGRYIAYSSAIMNLYGDVTVNNVAMAGTGSFNPPKNSDNNFDINPTGTYTPDASNLPSVGNCITNVAQKGYQANVTVRGGDFVAKNNVFFNGTSGSKIDITDANAISYIGDCVDNRFTGKIKDCTFLGVRCIDNNYDAVSRDLSGGKSRHGFLGKSSDADLILTGKNVFYSSGRNLYKNKYDRKSRANNLDGSAITNCGKLTIEKGTKIYAFDRTNSLKDKVYNRSEQRDDLEKTVSSIANGIVNYGALYAKDGLEIYSDGRGVVQRSLTVMKKKDDETKYKDYDGRNTESVFKDLIINGTFSGEKTKEQKIKSIGRNVYDKIEKAVINKEIDSDYKDYDWNNITNYKSVSFIPYIGITNSVGKMTLDGNTKIYSSECAVVNGKDTPQYLKENGDYYVNHKEGSPVLTIKAGTYRTTKQGTAVKNTLIGKMKIGTGTDKVFIGCSFGNEDKMSSFSKTGFSNSGEATVGNAVIRGLREGIKNEVLKGTSEKRALTYNILDYLEVKNVDVAYAVYGIFNTGRMIFEGDTEKDNVLQTKIKDNKVGVWQDGTFIMAKNATIDKSNVIHLCKDSNAREHGIYVYGDLPKIKGSDALSFEKDAIASDANVIELVSSNDKNKDDARRKLGRTVIYCLDINKYQKIADIKNWLNKEGTAGKATSYNKHEAKAEKDGLLQTFGNHKIAEPDGTIVTKKVPDTVKIQKKFRLSETSYDSDYHKYALRSGLGTYKGKEPGKYEPNPNKEKSQELNGGLGEIVLSAVLSVDYKDNFKGDIQGLTFECPVKKDGVNQKDLFFYREPKTLMTGFKKYVKESKDWKERVAIAKYKGRDIHKALPMKGWSFDENGKAEIFAENDIEAVLNWDRPLYAQWDSVGYNIFFDGNGQTNKAKNYTLSIGGGLKTKVTDGQQYVYMPDNDGPDHKQLPYFEKHVLDKHHFDKNKNEDIGYTKRHSFQGWSLNKKAMFLDDGVFQPNDTVKATGEKLSGLTDAQDFLGQALAAGAYDENTNSIRVYAVWDEYPEIQAIDVTFYDNELNDKNAVLSRLLSEDTVTAKDLEDGSIANGYIHVYTDITNRKFDIDELKGLGDEGSATVYYTVKDKNIVPAGYDPKRFKKFTVNETLYPIQVHVLAQSGEDKLDKVDPDGYDPITPDKLTNSGTSSSTEDETTFNIRYIDKENLEKTDFETPNDTDVTKGGLQKYSVWRLQEYHDELQQGVDTVDEYMSNNVFDYTKQALKNLFVSENQDSSVKTNTTSTQQRYVFTNKDIYDSQQFVKTNGPGNAVSDDALDRWNTQFKHCLRVHNTRGVSDVKRTYATVGVSSAHITWDLDLNTDEVQLTCKEKNGSDVQTVFVPRKNGNAQTQAYVNHLKPGTTYEYTVEAKSYNRKDNRGTNSKVLKNIFTTKEMEKPDVWVEKLVYENKQGRKEDLKSLDEEEKPKTLPYNVEQKKEYDFGKNGRQYSKDDGYGYSVNTNDNIVKIHWTVSATAAKYIVQKRTYSAKTGNGEWKNIATIGWDDWYGTDGRYEFFHEKGSVEDTKHYYFDQGMATYFDYLSSGDEGVYQYRVQAIGYELGHDGDNTYRHSRYSDYREVGFVYDVENVKVESGFRSLKVSWDKKDCADAYKITYKVADHSDATKTAFVKGDKTSVILPNIADDVINKNGKIRDYDGDEDTLLKEYSVYNVIVQPILYGELLTEHKENVAKTDQEPNTKIGANDGDTLYKDTLLDRDESNETLNRKMESLSGVQKEVAYDHTGKFASKERTRSSLDRVVYTNIVHTYMQQRTKFLEVPALYLTSGGEKAQISEKDDRRLKLRYYRMISADYTCDGEKNKLGFYNPMFNALAATFIKGTDKKGIRLQWNTPVKDYATMGDLNKITYDIYRADVDDLIEKNNRKNTEEKFKKLVTVTKAEKSGLFTYTDLPKATGNYCYYVLAKAPTLNDALYKKRFATEEPLVNTKKSMLADQCFVEKNKRDVQIGNSNKVTWTKDEKADGYVLVYELSKKENKECMIRAAFVDKGQNAYELDHLGYKKLNNVRVFSYICRNGDIVFGLGEKDKKLYDYYGGSKAEFYNPNKIVERNGIDDTEDADLSDIPEDDSSQEDDYDEGMDEDIYDDAEY